MVQRSVPERLSASSTDTETLAFRVSEISSAVDAAIETALRYAQEKAGVGDLNLVMKKLQGGDVTAWQYFNYCLAQQVSEYLGACDSHVQATYTFDYDATPEDVIFSDQVRDRLIHILVWVSRKTAALETLVRALDAALCESYVQRLGISRPKHVLDIQVVDDTEVQERTGYGALLASIHRQPLKIWSR